MTTKELDYKLVKDIARIRLVTATTKAPDTTISLEMNKIMDELDAGHEPKLIEEITKLLNNKDCAERIFTIMTRAYMTGILQKLNIRSNTRAAAVVGVTSSKKTVIKFSSADRAKASMEYLDQTQKAAKIIADGIADDKEEIIVNAAVAEAYGYNMKTAENMLIKTVKASLPAGSSEIDVSIVGFVSLATEAIEYSEKDKYYDRWIYERFQPIGVLKIQVHKP